MFHIFYDSTVRDFGFSIDNGANTYSGMGPLTVNAAPNAYVELFQVGPSSEDVLIDEFGMLLNHMLTPAQVTYLYNAGVGRTWPITLP